MGITRYEKAVKVLKNYIIKNNTNIIYTVKLRDLILKELGGDENRTTLPNLKMMRELGIIREIETNKWEINLNEN